MSIRLRKAEATDRDVILSLHRSLYENHRGVIMPQGREDLYAYRGFRQVLADDVDAMLRNPATAILLAEQTSETAKAVPVGYITGYVENDPRRVLDRKGIVGDWFVESAARGQGVGRQLLEALLAIFREAGCNISEIATWPFNEGTRRHIRAAGYEEIQIVYRQKL